MTDGIIKGNGNSRYLKTVADALTLYPTYQDFMAAFIAGTLPVDLNGINAEGWRQIGTALNKANLLKDATAAKFGLGADAVPDDVFGVLSRFHSELGNEYVWSKTKLNVSYGYVNSPDISAYPPAVDDGFTYKLLGQLANFGTKIETGSYTGTGTHGSRNPNSLTFRFVPKLLFVMGNCGIYAVANSQYGISFFSSGGNSYQGVTVNWSNTTVSWYGYSDAQYQCNISGLVYSYVAIG